MIYLLSASDIEKDIVRRRNALKKQLVKNVSQKTKPLGLSSRRIQKMESSIQQLSNKLNQLLSSSSRPGQNALSLSFYNLCRHIFSSTITENVKDNWHPFFNFVNELWLVDGPVDVIIAPHCKGQASMGCHYSGDICLGTLRRLGVTGIDWLIDWLIENGIH